MGMSNNKTLSFTSVGVPIEVRSNSSDLLERLRVHLPPGAETSHLGLPQRRYTLQVDPAEPTADETSIFTLSVDGAEIDRSNVFSNIGKTFETDSRLFIAEMTTERVIVHAGVVGWNGKAIVIPGRTYTGKTTLVASLVQAGALYFSDEYAVFDHHGLVHPYPKPLSIRDPHTGEQVDHPVESFNGQTSSHPLPVGLVLVSAYQQDAVWAPDRLTPGEGMLALVDNSISIRRSPELVLRTLTRVVATAEILKGSRGDADDVVRRLKLRYT